jgi:S-adenosylmethionine:tRNA ribosyltransferase-isomerase
MRLSELDYELPPELIAQEPLQRRDQARMLVLERKSKSVEHSRFYKLARHLRTGDLIVLNDTRVLPARLFAKKETGGRVEMLLVRPVDSPREGPAGAWIALVRTHRVLKDNTRLILDDGHALKVVGYARPGRPIVVSDDGTAIDRLLEIDGMLALPHYIHRTVGAADLDDYQTVYAAKPGAIAAPTAGLHFTDDVFKSIADAGIRTATVTLHIGPGTFAPVRAPEIESHTMEAEWFTIPPATQTAIDHTRRVGGRIITVGTSSTRALESWAITGEADVVLAAVKFLAAENPLYEKDDMP